LDKDDVYNTMYSETLPHLQKVHTDKLYAVGGDFCEDYYLGKPQPLNEFSLDRDDNLKSFSV